jgi:type I restriction enzyme S subunit
MKNNWQTKKLGEVCDFLSGLWKGKEPPYIRIGVIRNTNFAKEGKLDDSDIASLDVEKKQFAKRKLNYGDIILEKSGGGPKQPVGRVIIFDKKEGDFSFSNFTSTIRIKNARELDFNFLHKYLFFSYISGVTDRMQSHSTGIRNLDNKLYKAIEIPLPPLSEQKRIVKILDEVFEGIGKAKENVETNLKNSRELFESYLQNIFANPRKNWKEKNLKDVCCIQSKLINPRKPEFLDLIHIGAGNIEIKTGELINLKTSREERLISGKFEFDNSMVLYSKIRPYLMKVVRPNFKGLCSADIYPLLPHINLMIRDYLFYLLLTSVFTEFAIKGSARAGMPKVNREHLFTFSFFIPSLSEQKSIVKKLDALAEKTKKLEEIYKQKISDLDELKKSVLKKAFCGEL